MAIKNITYNSKVYLPIIECGEVALCLGSAWAARTTSGKRLLLATVGTNGRYLGPEGCDMSVLWKNPRGLDLFQYDFSFDDVQLIVNPATPGLKWILPCDAINSVFDACIANLILPLT